MTKIPCPESEAISTKFPERGKVIDACKKKGAARSLYDGDSRQNFQSDHAVFERCQWKRFIQLHRPFYHEKKKFHLFLCLNKQI